MIGAGISLWSQLHGAGSAPPSSYVANPIHADGTNDFFLRSSDLEGAIDSKLLTGSVWVRRLGGEGTLQRLFVGTFGIPAMMFFNTSNLFKVVIRNAANTTILDMQSATAITGSAWHHVMWSVDLTDVTKRHLYLDGASALHATITYINDTMDLTRTSWAFGALPNGTENILADIADLQIWFGVYADLSQASNRSLLLDSGCPGDPALAAASFGSPIVGFIGPTATWRNNIGGTGGVFVENGAITDGSVEVHL